MTRDISSNQFAAALQRHGFESAVMGWKDGTGRAPGVCFMPVLTQGGCIHRRQTLARLLQRRAAHVAEKGSRK